LPFQERTKIFLNVHEELPIQCKQCVQVLLQRKVFTIPEKINYGNQIAYHSFRYNDSIKKILDGEREKLACLYLDFLSKLQDMTPFKLSEIVTRAYRELNQRGLVEKARSLRYNSELRNLVIME